MTSSRTWASRSSRRRPQISSSTIEDTPTAVLVRQVLGAIAEFEKASLVVARLKAARDRKIAQGTDLALIERLTQERDQARRELELALQSVQPRVVGPDNPSRCFVCLRRRPEVKVMLDLSRRRQEVFLCDECIDEMSRMSNERAARLEQ
jgi:hypothetical protein